MASVLAALLPWPIALIPATSYIGPEGPPGKSLAEAFAASPGTTPSH